MNFMSSLFCPSATEVPRQSHDAIAPLNFFDADTARFGRLEFTGSSLRYLKPNCAIPPPFSAKVGAERLFLSVMLMAARLIEDAAWALRLVVSIPAFCRPAEATVISQPSSLIVVSLSFSG
jgi:hypothetical protein